ncbi:MAG: hypothetical protein KatS3mg014_0640 [Actinomycetota bacterium]|nr:MAG: hypothetical protein KatS3mg014_0640 [Actinomycetota bacterium]
MRRTFVLLAALALAPALAVPAGAITDGVPDGEGHPYVGLMVAQDADGNPLWRCSGTLISEDLFLTAGHCTEAPADHVEIWFAPGPIEVDPDYPAEDGNRCAGISGYPCVGDVGGTPYTHPQYDPDAFWLHDLGVVVLDEPMAMERLRRPPEAEPARSAPAPSQHPLHRGGVRPPEGVPARGGLEGRGHADPDGRPPLPGADQHRVHRRRVPRALEQRRFGRHLLRRLRGAELRRDEQRDRRRDVLRAQLDLRGERAASTGWIGPTTWGGWPRSGCPPPRPDPPPLSGHAEGVARGHPLLVLEPAVGLEPTTCGLQDRCSPR